MNNSIIKSFVVTHKFFPGPLSSPYFTVIAKNGYVPSDGDYVLDSVGDNISHLSATWAEITAMYWVWKNITGVDFVSFPHYRRYFWCISNDPYFQGRVFYINPNESNMAALTSQANVEAMLRIMEYSDCIVARPHIFPVSIAEQYKRCLIPDWDLFCTGVALLGREYKQALPLFDYSNSMHCYQLFVMPWKEFDEYMEIVYSFLNWLNEQQRCYETEIVTTRVPAMMMERFFNLYLHVKRLRKFEAPVALLETSAF